MGIPSSNCHAVLMPSLFSMATTAANHSLSPCAASGRERRPHFPRYVTIRRNRTNTPLRQTDKGNEGNQGRLALLLLSLGTSERARTQELRLRCGTEGVRMELEGRGAGLWRKE